MRFFEVVTTWAVPGDRNRYPTEAMTRKRRLATALIAGAAMAIVAGVFAARYINRSVTRQHQLNVIHELNGWADDYSAINDRDAAVRAAGMIDYISTYYPIADGYRSDPETENLLNHARQDAMQRIAVGISRYTGTVMNNPLDWPAELCDNSQAAQDGG